MFDKHEIVARGDATNMIGFIKDQISGWDIRSDIFDKVAEDVYKNLRNKDECENECITVLPGDSLLSFMMLKEGYDENNFVNLVEDSIEKFM